MAWLMVKVGDRERGHELDEEITFVGTAEDAAVRLPGGGVAPKHCQVLRAGDEWRILDLGAEGGTRVNGQSVSQHVLASGDRIQVGGVEMVFQLSRTTPPASPSAAPPTRPSAAAPATPQAASGPPRRAPKSGAGRAPARPGAARRPAAGATRRAPTRAARGRQGSDAAPVRRNLRNKEGLPEPAVWGLIVLCLLTASFVVYKLVTHEKIDVDGLILQANNAEEIGDYSAATLAITAAKEAIDEDHKHWDYVCQLYEEIVNKQKNLDENRDFAAEKSLYLTNVAGWHDKYPGSDNPQFKDDPTTARYFVEYRLKPFMERFPNSPNMGQVKAWLNQYQRLYDESDPFPNPDRWWDYEVISQMEMRLEVYGVGYQVLQSYLDARPNGPKVKTCQRKMQDCLWEAKRNFLDTYILTTIENILSYERPNYPKAMGYVRRGLDNLKGIDDYYQQVIDAGRRIQAHAEEHGKKLDWSGFPEITAAQ